MRKFEPRPAKRERVPMLVGAIGPSGSGKTLSALRMAKGMTEVTGGKIRFIDTEARRALHYADSFDFEHIPLDPPFSPLDYLEAIEFTKGRGGENDVIILDSMSHEHEGQGGVLEMHAAESERLVKAWKSTEDKVKFAAWIKPKQQRRRLINSVLQMGVNAIFCFRAKEKTKPGGGKGKDAVIHLGWQPIAGEEFIFEMLLNFLLYPRANGFPNWKPNERAEDMMLKLPKNLEHCFPHGEQITETTGARIAEWAKGKPSEANKDSETSGKIDAGELESALAEIALAKDRDSLDRVMAVVKGQQDWSSSDSAVIRDAIMKRRVDLESA